MISHLVEREYVEDNVHVKKCWLAVPAVSRKEAAKMLKMPPDRLPQLIQDGKLEQVPKQRGFLVTAESLMEYIGEAVPERVIEMRNLYLKREEADFGDGTAEVRHYDGNGLLSFEFYWDKVIRMKTARTQDLSAAVTVSCDFYLPVSGQRFSHRACHFDPDTHIVDINRAMDNYLSDWLKDFAYYLRKHDASNPPSSLLNLVLLPARRISTGSVTVRRSPQAPKHLRKNTRWTWPD
jgi:hypothetical protein